MVNYLHISDNFAKFVAWIGGSCKPSDKGKLTPLPRFTFCQHNFNNASSMLKFEELPEVNSERWLSLEDLPDERWRVVDGYRGLLYVSNYGRLKRLAYLADHPICKKVRRKEMILRLNTVHFGYYHATLCLDRKFYNLYPHQLVAKAFLPNPNNYPVVNHKDENPKNDVVWFNTDGSIDVNNSNLEWCTQKHNSNWGNASAKKIEAMKRNGMIRPVVLYDNDGNIIEEYESISEAERRNNIKGIFYSCSGKISSVKGLNFRYKGEPYVKRQDKSHKAVCTLIKEEGNQTFNGVMSLCKAIGINAENIEAVIRGKVKNSKSLKDKHILIEYVNGLKVEIKNGCLNQ